MKEDTALFCLYTLNDSVFSFSFAPYDLTIYSSHAESDIALMMDRHCVSFSLYNTKIQQCLKTVKQIPYCPACPH